jgi:hypothetical protein
VEQPSEEKWASKCTDNNETDAGDPAPLVFVLVEDGCRWDRRLGRSWQDGRCGDHWSSEHSQCDPQYDQSIDWRITAAWIVDEDKSTDDYDSKYRNDDDEDAGRPPFLMLVFVQALCRRHLSCRSYVQDARAHNE